MDKASCLDMVLLVDLSTSMADAIHWLANVSALLENRLIEEAKEYRCQDRLVPYPRDIMPLDKSWFLFT